MTNLKDAYEIFFKEFEIDLERLAQFGINETIKIEPEKAKIEWDILKKKLSGEIPEIVYIRGAGRDANTTQLYLDLFENLFPNVIFKKDPTNNAKPRRLIETQTGFKRSEKKHKNYESITNYQVSHIFGRTKNPYAFVAPWNVVFLPKIIDPFTGHESKGEFTNTFINIFQNHFQNIYEEMILEFDEEMIKCNKAIQNYVSSLDHLNEKTKKYTPNQIKKFKETVFGEFSPIIKKTTEH